MDLTEMIVTIQNLDGLQILGAVVVVFAVSHTKTLIRIMKGKPAGIERHVDVIVAKKIKIYEIRKHRILEEQMEKVSRSMISLKAIMMQNYRELIDGKEGAERDLRAYDKICDYMITEVKGFIRKWIYQNHLLEKTDIEFREYTEKTALALMELMTSILNAHIHTGDFLVTRSEIRNNNYSRSVNTVTNLIEEMLYDIRKIAQDKEKEIAEYNDD